MRTGDHPGDLLLGVLLLDLDKAVKFIKRKFGRGFTFLVVPNSSGANTRSITIPFSLILVVITIIVFNLVLFIGFFVQVGTIYTQSQTIYQTKRENHKLHKEQREVKPTLKKSYIIVEELNVIKKERIRINSIWKSIQQKGGRMVTQASRGTSIRISPYMIPLQQVKDGTVKTSLEELKYNLSQINGYIKEEKEQQTKLLSDLTAYERLLDHTPSKWPVASFVVSWFGWRYHPVFRKSKEHEGVDLEAAYGTKVRAAADGIVSFAGWDGGYGYLIKIDHGYGYETRYGHNSRILVYVGQAVKKGQVISLSGSSGVATGPHLHYEVRINNQPVNPVSFLRN
jgi:murein DD-endopeptidase MepM/ murein hydrolase activator NlpD